MKKLYFLLASLLAFSTAQAQTFTFNYNDKAVEGTTLECNESDLHVTPDAVGDQIFGYEIKLAPHISVSVDLGDEIEGALAADLNVKSLNGHKVQCCAGGERHSTCEHAGRPVQRRQYAHHGHESDGGHGKAGVLHGLQ